MAGAVATGAPPEKRDLYGNLIGDHLVLFQDVLDRPEDYEEGLPELLTELINGKKLDELDPMQRDMLNRAAIDFVQTPARRQKPVTQGPPVKQPVPDAVAAALGEHDSDGESPDIPAGPPTFWWTRTEAERSRTD